MNGIINISPHYSSVKCQWLLRTEAPAEAHCYRGPSKSLLCYSMFSAGLPVYALQYLYSDSSIIQIRSHKYNMLLHLSLTFYPLYVVRVV